MKNVIKRHRRFFTGLIISVSAMIFLTYIEIHFQPQAIDGLYFQEYTSEIMVQTVPIEELKSEPLISLWNIHIQPPGFDMIRAFLAFITHAENSDELARQVDRKIYILWIIVYGLTVFMFYWWLSELTSITFASVTSILFSLNPGLIFYATYLETTLLSALLILCLCYLLWRIKEKNNVSAWTLAGLFIIIYLTRSIFQWHWVIILPVCLALMKYPLKKLILFTLIISCFTGLFTLKQIKLFGLSSTSSFTGLNLYKSLGIGDVMTFYKPMLELKEEDSSLPGVLSRVYKTDKILNYNNIHHLEVNRALQKEYLRYVKETPLSKLEEAALFNLNIYMQPASRTTTHIIVDQLQWRKLFDYLDAAPVLPVLLFLSVLIWIIRTKKVNFLPAVGLCIPVIIIFTLSVLFERWENMRYKFFIIPVIFCFIASQIYSMKEYYIKNRRNNNS